MKKNLNYSSIMRECLKYDVVSFDCFDTLIFRIFTSPEDLFSFLGFEYGIPNFSQLRMKAEKEVRDLNKEKYGARECYIEEIYKKLSRMTAIDPRKGIELEIEYEKKVCYANTFMKNVYNQLIKEGKEVVITSNMYLGKEILADILRKNNFQLPSKIFVSCDYHKNKRGGELFSEILKVYKDKKIVHIGDDLSADIKGAEAAGIDAILYKRCTDDKKNLVIGKSSHLTSSIYNAIVSNYLNNKFSVDEFDHKNKYFRYGFKYGGLFILGYVRKIIEWCKQDGIEKILFLARDGDFLKKVYKSIAKGNALPFEYVYWSRRAAMQIMPEIYMDDYFNNIVSRRVNAGIYLSFEEFCEKLGIPAKHIDEISKNDKIDKFNLQVFKEYFYSQQSELESKSAKLKSHALNYLKKIIGNSKRIAIVDIGWRASGALSIERLLKKDSNDQKIDIISYVAGNYKRKPGYDTIQAYRGKIRSYMFSEYENYDIADDFQKNIGKLVPIIEIFGASSTSPSFIGFSESGDFVFDVPEAENYKIIQDIHEGELEFILEFSRRTDKLLDEYEIPGRDVYFTLKNALNNKSLIKDLKDYTYPQFVSDNGTDLKIDCLGDFWGV